jgi:predicted nucleic acid-binding protein
MLRDLLHTTICIDVIKRRPESLLERFNHNAAHLAIASITLAELLHRAHARSEGLTLVSNDLREFERVDGLLDENWA